MTIRADPASTSSSRSGKKRKRSTSDEQKKAMIREALRLDQLRANVKKRESCFVYVGNVNYLPIVLSVILTHTRH